MPVSSSTVAPGFTFSLSIYFEQQKIMKTSEDSILLFAYGTLRRGESNDICNLGNPIFKGYGHVRGVLYDIGHCPGMLLNDAGIDVRGEIFEITPDMLPILDSVEDDCGDFPRRVAPVQHDTLGTMHCIVYETGRRQVIGQPLIDSGDWIAHRLERDGLMEPAEPWMYPVGDSAVGIDVPLLATARWERDACPENVSASSIATWLRKTGLLELADIVPSYDVITIHFRPEHQEKTVLKLRTLFMECAVSQKHGKTIEIPVCYDGEFGLDLELVARQKNLAVEEIIALHTAPLYEVKMIGFMPGFPYLEGLDARLNTPRLASPRLRVNPGSIGIGGGQTGIYPHASPGGWNLIGGTGVKLFSSDAADPCLLEPGDSVKFVPVTPAMHRDIVHGAAWA